MSRLFDGISPKLTASVCEKCCSVGIKTVTDFILNDPEDLAKKIKVPYKDILSIYYDLSVNFGSIPQNALSLQYELLESLSVISTGSKSINNLLRGGIYTGEITEIHGLPASGKTQFCFSLIATLILETRNSALYFDTRGNYSSVRLEEILLGKCERDQTAINKLQNIKIRAVYDIYELFDCLENLKKKLSEQDSTFVRFLKLVVVDAITPLLSPCFGEKFVSGPGVMNTLSEILHGLCKDYNLSILLCNATVRGEDSVPKPALGPNWKYIPSVSLCIDKIPETSRRSIRIIKSCRSGLFGGANFEITSAGVVDC